MADYFVDPVSGDNGNAGTSAGAAWATTAYACTQMVEGGRCFLMATGPEAIASTVTLPAYKGVVFVGANSSGVEDGTQYEYGCPPGTSAFDCVDGTIYRQTFRNVYFNGPGGSSPSAFDNATCVCYNCLFDGFGVALLGNSSNHVYATMVNCVFSNTLTASYAGSNRQTAEYYFCLFHPSVGEPWDTGGTNYAALGCIFNQSGVIGHSHYGACHFVNNTIYGCAVEVGDRPTSSQAPIFINNVFVNSPGYGILWTAGNDSYPIVMQGNLFYNNTSGHLGTPPPGVAIGYDSIVDEDPLFADAAGGDFTPSATSPLRGAGIGGVDIGAVRAADPAGGGGGTRAFVG